jgi:ComF family protein
MIVTIDYSALLRRAFHAVLPVACASCGVALKGDPIPFFCRSCWSSIAPFKGPCCPVCGQPFKSDQTLLHSPAHRCADCRRRRPAFTRAWSLYPYVPPLQEAIQLFKYKKKISLANALGSLIDSALLDAPEVDAVVPVPLHVTRLREREYNQALLLADRFCRTRRLPLSFDNLVRTRPTQPQTDLTRPQRLGNLRTAFAARRPEELKGRRLMLIDDVFTTGATVNECAKVMRKAGASQVYVVTLARTV